MHSGGSFADLSAQDESPMVDSTVPAGGQQAGVGLHLRKAVGHSGTVTIKLENIKQERLKTVSTSEWVSSAAQPLQGQRSSVRLPPIPALGESQPCPCCEENANASTECCKSQLRRPRRHPAVLFL